MQATTLLCLLAAVACPAQAVDPVAHLTSLTTNLQSKVDGLTKQLAAMQADVTHKASQITSLHSQLQQRTASIANLTKQLNADASKLATLDTYCTSHIDADVKRIEALETPVAFTVRFTNDTVGNKTAKVGIWQYLKFDLVQFQTGGNNYNTSTGFFTAPTNGAYAFFLTMQRNDALQNDCLEAYILKNNNWIAAVTACPQGYTSASNMATIYMRKGDKVHVQTTHSERIFAYVHTSFSGFRLSPK